jgi:DNA-binding NarL/FixJ family response regulator
MKTKRRLLLVEDTAVQAQGLRVDFEANGWQIERAHDTLSTLKRLSETRPGKEIGAVALDLGLPPTRDDPTITGLDLAATLREENPSLPILAYTSLPINRYEVSQVIATLLPLRISFIHLRPLRGEASLADLLELTWRGFVLLSPDLADFLPDAVPTFPDPLTDELWETLRLLNEGNTYEETADILPITADGVRNRLKRVARILQDIGELESHQTTRDDLLTWYKRHRVRFRRR